MMVGGIPKNRCRMERPEKQIETQIYKCLKSMANFKFMHTLKKILFLYP